MVGHLVGGMIWWERMVGIILIWWVYMVGAILLPFVRLIYKIIPVLNDYSNNDCGHNYIVSCQKSLNRKTFVRHAMGKIHQPFDDC